MACFAHEPIWSSSVNPRDDPAFCHCKALASIRMNSARVTGDPDETSDPGTR